MSGLSHRYDLGGEHPLVDRDAPRTSASGTAPGWKSCRGRGGVVLDFRGALGSATRTREDRIRRSAGPAEDDLGLDVVLVRPDGVVV